MFSSNNRYFIIDQQIAGHFVHYSECLFHPPSLLCHSNNQPFSYFKVSANHDKGSIICRISFIGILRHSHKNILILQNLPSPQTYFLKIYFCLFRTNFRSGRSGILDTILSTLLPSPDCEFKDCIQYCYQNAGGEFVCSCDDSLMGSWAQLNDSCAKKTCYKNDDEEFVCECCDCTECKYC